MYVCEKNDRSDRGAKNLCSELSVDEAGQNDDSDAAQVAAAEDLELLEELESRARDARPREDRGTRRARVFAIE